MHHVLSAAFARVAQLDTSGRLRGRLAALRLDFPEAAPLAVTPAGSAAGPLHPIASQRLAPKLTTRKLAPYARAVHIARLLLLDLHPDLRGGRAPALALLFDINAMWEGFRAAALRRRLPAGFRVSAQATTPSWTGDNGQRTTLRPDLLVDTPGGQRIGLDAKCKYRSGAPKPSAADLRQLYAYADHFDCDTMALVYPGAWGAVRGAFAKTAGRDGAPSATLLAIPVHEADVHRWMGSITEAIRRIGAGAEEGSLGHPRPRHAPVVGAQDV